jgi:anti-sigma regulatory factor (Ser/Thr protein kinase)
MQQFNRVYPNIPQSVIRARRAVGAFAARMGFSAADVSDIVLAVGEACNNAAEHGRTPNGRVAVTCSFDGRSLAVDVVDDGSGFDVPSARSSGASEHELPRGRGMAIMRALMDDVYYKSGKAGTIVRMEKRSASANGTHHAAERGA